ncbi:hypothetical protein DH2020_008893 [Rehmannia glutinosa]|uniref:Peroxidase n=1 Tax=Rehmannia glutinosa TaxID=99300 RepID=A0ABR0X858_REHGL
MSSNSKPLIIFLLAILYSTVLSASTQNEKPTLVINYYRDSCPQAEDIIKEQVKLLYKRHKNTAFSWLRNIFHDCFVESCDASLLLDSTRRVLSEKETDRSFGMRNFRYIETIKEALERECPGVVSCSDILVGGPYISLKTGRRDGRKSRADIIEKYLPDHNESISVVLERFANIGIDTPGVVALLEMNCRLIHKTVWYSRSSQCGANPLCETGSPLYPEVDPSLNPDHVEHMLHKCPDPIPDPKAVQYVRNDRGTPMKLDNNYYRNILDNKGLLIVDHQLATDKRTKPFVKKMAKSQDYFFKEFARAITILSENNPLTGTKGEIRKQCNLANKLH